MLYDELSAMENLAFFGGLKGIRMLEPRPESLLKKVGLLDRADDAVSRLFFRHEAEAQVLLRLDRRP
ncbi:MAG: hypothetical protein MZV49_05120 [Rhodopseudomonas palustris]|nr:hypothetical protein [Rhodopseudomonas palustris]